MKSLRSYFAAATVMLMLSGCLGTLAPPATSPAPLSRTAIDEQSVIVAMRSYDLVLTLVELGVDTGALHGARAVKVKAALVRVSHAIDAARAAQRAGSADSYTEAIAAATTALVDARAALGN
ncbi:MAG TPA: hypothetical protein DDZ68_12860 [Parvularcula sp.]|nr:hypothetical protein [Parvularcula sp.]